WFSRASRRLARLTAQRPLVKRCPRRLRRRGSGLRLGPASLRSPPRGASPRGHGPPKHCPPAPQEPPPPAPPPSAPHHPRPSVPLDLPFPVRLRSRVPGRPSRRQEVNAAHGRSPTARRRLARGRPPHSPARRGLERLALAGAAAADRCRTARLAGRQHRG